MAKRPVIKHKSGASEKAGRWVGHALWVGKSLSHTTENPAGRSDCGSAGHPGRSADTRAGRLVPTKSPGRVRCGPADLYSGWMPGRLVGQIRLC